MSATCEKCGAGLSQIDGNWLCPLCDMFAPKDVEELKERVQRSEAALIWYQEKAEAVKRYMTDKSPKGAAIPAILIELAGDGGNRAAEVLKGA